MSKSVRTTPSKMVLKEQSNSKYVQHGSNGAWANQEELIGAGRKNVFTKAHLPPATKKALKSVGKSGVKSAGVIGSNGLGMLEDSSKIVRKQGAKIIAAKALSAMSGAGLPIKRKYVKKVKQVVADAVESVPDEVKDEIKSQVKSRAKKVVKQVKEKVKDEIVGSGKPKRAPSKWVEFVKKYAKDNNVSYKVAIKDAKVSYHASKK